MKALLREEFDNRFSISTTQHFVVVHPRGQWSAWSDRLESLYRSFTHYMQVRGFRLSRPKYPLVAVVFRNQGDYYAHARAGGTPLQPGTLGHYDPASNRVFLFDAGSKDWSANAETIIHEATHQSAFNVGVHRRFAEQPRWLVEGLGSEDALAQHAKQSPLGDSQPAKLKILQRCSHNRALPCCIPRVQRYRAGEIGLFATSHKR